jgi:hypothetical protein
MSWFANKKLAAKPAATGGAAAPSGGHKQQNLMDDLMGNFDSTASAAKPAATGAADPVLDADASRTMMLLQERLKLRTRDMERCTSP